MQRTVAVRRLHPHPHIPNIPTNRRASINKCGETRPYRPQAHAHAATMPSPAPVEPRVADHFPRKAKQCEKPAERFFACFSAKGDQPAGGVSRAVVMRARGFTGGKPVHCMKRQQQHIGCVRLTTPTPNPHPRHHQDKEAGRRGLAECQKEMAAYDACMQKWLAKNPGKQALFRVRAARLLACRDNHLVYMSLESQSPPPLSIIIDPGACNYKQVQEEYRASTLQAKQQSQ